MAITRKSRGRFKRTRRIIRQFRFPYSPSHPKPTTTIPFLYTCVNFLLGLLRQLARAKGASQKGNLAKGPTSTYPLAVEVPSKFEYDHERVKRVSDARPSFKSDSHCPRRRQRVNLFFFFSFFLLLL